MNSKQIELIPAALEGDYADFRTRIRERLADSLENGDAIIDMKLIYGDFLRAMSHTLEEFDAPEGMLERVLAIDDRCTCHMDQDPMSPVPNYCPIHDGDYSSFLASNNCD